MATNLSLDTLLVSEGGDLDKSEVPLNFEMLGAHIFIFPRGICVGG